MSLWRVECDTCGEYIGTVDSDLFKRDEDHFCMTCARLFQRANIIGRGDDLKHLLKVIDYRAKAVAKEAVDDHVEFLHRES